MSSSFGSTLGSNQGEFWLTGWGTSRLLLNVAQPEREAARTSPQKVNNVRLRFIGLTPALTRAASIPQRIQTDRARGVE